MSNNWMTPKDYFEHIVEPTAQEYWADRSDHQKENAIFQLSSFSERYFKYHKEKGNSGKIYGATTGEEFGQKVFEQCPEYGLLWDSANAVKHHFPGARPRPSVLVTTATGVWTDQVYNVGGRWVTTDQAMKTTYEFWRKLLDAESD